MRGAGGAALAACLAAAGLLAGGCSSPSKPTNTTATTSGPTSSSPGSGPSSTVSSVPTLAHCQPSGLSATVVGTSGAAGTIEVTMELKNTSTTSCALEGYPGLQLLSSTGNQLPTDVVRGGSYSFTDFAPAPVTLAAGAASYFNMGYSDVASSSGSCPTASSMWVTPPDDVNHLVVNQSVMACNGGSITVSPVFAAGSAQTQTTAP